MSQAFYFEKGGRRLKINVLPLETVRNPRDLGGYLGDDHRPLKKHRLIRAGKINDISMHDEKFLKEYGLTKIIDLRSSSECKMCPDEMIPGIKHYHMGLSDEDNTQGGQKDIDQTFAKYRQDQYAGFRMMCQRYHDHIAKPHSQKAIHDILELLANTEDGAVLYHCSEGKDRTGIVTMIILYLLGVDWETIRQDYLYSNWMLVDYRAKRDQKFKEHGENLKFRANMRVLGSVANSFFDTSLLTIKDEFDGMESYMQNQIKVTPELRAQLRELYLEKK